MPDDLGSPQANDATAQIERRINLAAQELARRNMSEGPSIVNRPIGSKPLTDDDILNDYQSMLADPAMVADRYIKRAAQVGENLALAELVEFHDRGYKLLEKRANGSTK